MKKAFILPLILFAGSCLALAQVSTPLDLSQTGSDEGLESGIAVAGGYNSNEFGIVWADAWDLKFAVVKQIGQVVQPTNIIASLPDEIFGVAMIRVRNYYIIVIEVYSAFGSRLYFLRTDLQGTPLMNPVQLTFNANDHEHPSLSSDGRRIGLAWMEDDGAQKHVNFAVLSLNGSFLSPVQQVGTTNISWGKPFIRCDWNSALRQFGVVWRELVGTASAINIRRYSTSANPTMPAKVLRVFSGLTGLDMACGNGGSCNLVFALNNNSKSWVQYMKFNAQLTALVVNRRLSHPKQSSSYPAIAYDRVNQEYWVSWTQQKIAPGATGNIYASRINSAGAMLNSMLRITSAPNWDGLVDICTNGSSVFFGFLRDFPVPGTTGHYAQVFACTYTP